MKHYYKAVRPDGTDFRTGTVDYASLSGTGNPLPVLGGGDCCTDGVYHASTVAAETLIGGEWPCRLFKVYGVPVSEEGTKRGFRTLFVGKELPSHKALGPNGKKVAAHIERCKTITPEQANAWYAAWYAGRSAARDAAWYAAWYAGRSAARNVAWSAARNAAWGAAQNAAWSAARDVAWYAAAALVVQDLISEEHFNILYGPWRKVMDNG